MVEENVLRVLMLEDSPLDADLEMRELRGDWHDLSVHRVNTQGDFVLALRTFTPDVILIDNNPYSDSDGTTALDAAVRFRPEAPVILVTAAMGEDKVAEVLKRGATDVVLKDHPGRLLPAVRRAIRAAEARSERKRLEREAANITRRNDAILASAGEGILGLDAHGVVTFVNATAVRILGACPDDMVGKPAAATWNHGPANGNSYPAYQSPIIDTIRNGKAYRGLNGRFWRMDGSSFPAEFSSTPIMEDGKVAGAVVTFDDITERHERERELVHTHERLTTLLTGTIQTIARMSETRDPYTAGHQQRVGRLAAAIGKELGWPEDRRQGIYYCGLLHDIGKIAVPSEILSRPGQLSSAETEMIRIHPAKAYDVLAGLDFPWPVALVALQHHERLDGSGYPDGLSGDAIIEEARIIAVADVVEAMSSHRPYRPGLGVDTALDEILRQSGTALDAVAVEACVRLLQSGEGRALLSTPETE